MPTDRVYSDVSAFSGELRQLHKKRKRPVADGRKTGTRRGSLTKSDRAAVLRKTDGHCHVCGGHISESDWQADHVLAHSTGGKHAIGNYLPAHSICNNYRWHYAAEEFQWIVKLGVWMRTQIEKETTIGRAAGQKFCDHERRRAGRRKPPQ